MNYETERVFSLIQKAARLGVISLEEIENLDKSRGDVSALVEGLQASSEGRHRHRVAAALDALIREVETKGPLYDAFPAAADDPIWFRRRMVESEPILSMPDDCPIFRPSLDRAKRRFLRTARIMLWRERLEWFSCGENTFQLRDQGDHEWSSPFVVEYTPDGRMEMSPRKTAAGWFGGTLLPSSK
jgi:hypothetical protein